VRLSATVEALPPQRCSFTPFGNAPLKPDALTVTPHVTSLLIEADGQELWKAGASTFTRSIRGKLNQSPKEAAAEHSAPDLSFFADVRLPKYASKPREAFTIGQSRITLQGVTPVGGR
jgi:hypothetical protein